MEELFPTLLKSAFCGESQAFLRSCTERVYRVPPVLISGRKTKTSSALLPVP